MKEKQKHIFVDSETHRQAKIQALRDGLSIKDYLKKLLDGDKNEK